MKSKQWVVYWTSQILMQKKGNGQKPFKKFISFQLKKINSLIRELTITLNKGSRYSLCSRYFNIHPKRIQSSCFSIENQSSVFQNVSCWAQGLLAELQMLVYFVASEVKLISAFVSRPAPSVLWLDRLWVLFTLILWWDGSARWNEKIVGIQRQELIPNMLSVCWHYDRQTSGSMRFQSILKYIRNLLEFSYVTQKTP